MSKYHTECHVVLKDADVFPIEVDLSRSTFTYDKSNQFNDEEDDDDDDEVLEVSEEPTTPSSDVNLISTD
jgi:hypothetical protein